MTFRQLELMDLHLDALFTRDADGRLRSINEPDGLDAPRFWMGRTPLGNRWRMRYDLAAPLAAELERLSAGEPVTAEFEPAPRMREPIMALLAGYAPIVDEYRGPAYILPDDLAQNDDAVIVTSATASVLERWFGWLVQCAGDAACGPVAAVLDGGDAVAVCHCARITPRACEAGVETVEGYRGHGYAPQAVTAWAAAVRQTGRLPLYSTWWDNLASRAVARRLGMLQYGEDWSIT